MQAIMPTDPRLRAVVTRARELVAAGDPLAAALAGGALGHPPVDIAAEKRAVEGISQLAAQVEALGPLPVAADEHDRQALLFGLRRGAASARPGEPVGAIDLERHLLLALSRLAVGMPGAENLLLRLLEATPDRLRHARGGIAPGTGRAAGHAALEAAHRVPALLDACAGAVAEAGVDRQAREGVEAALGPVLQAAAEEAGWLLKEFLQAAPDLPPARLVDPLWAGLGMSAEELEDDAEDLLAGVVAAAGGVSAAGTPPPGPPASVEDVARAWEAAAARAAERWGIAPHSPVSVLPAPGWLRPLLPPLALVAAGPLGGVGDVVLVAGIASHEVDEQVALMHDAEYIPLAARAEIRLARTLLPAPDTDEGWRGLVLEAAAPGAPAPGAELAWRASLALSALAMARGAASAADAAAMISAESGVDGETAASQAREVGRNPLAALTFLAGRRAMHEVREAQGDRAAAALLRDGPLPAGVMRLLAGGTPGIL